MKGKMFGAMVLSGLLVSSLSFAVSDMDGMDDTSGTAGMQNLAMDNSNNSNGIMQNPGGDPPSGNNLANPNSNTNSNSSSVTDSNSSATQNANDDMSADTATGDDDY